MDEYQEVVRKFYEVYARLAKRYNLSLHNRFEANKMGSIKIYQGSGSNKKQIVKAEREDATECFREATEDLEIWEKEREENE